MYTDYLFISALEEDNTKIVAMLNSGLNKILENVKIDNISSHILEQYGCMEKRNAFENCNVIFKVINDLTSELNLKKNLEKALEDEDIVIKELSEKVKQKEIGIYQLETDVQKLKTIVSDTKTGKFLLRLNVFVIYCGHCGVAHCLTVNAIVVSLILT